MIYKKIVAIVRKSNLEKIERALIKLGSKGITVNQVKGFGEYANFYALDWMVSATHVQIEMFVLEDEVETLVKQTIEAAHTGAAGDGFVAVLPVDTVYRIRTKRPAMAGEI